MPNNQTVREKNWPFGTRPLSKKESRKIQSSLNNYREERLPMNTPFFYQVVEDFQKKARTLLGEDITVVVEGENFSFSDHHDVLFEGNGPICGHIKNKKVFIPQVLKVGELTNFDDFRIEQRKFEGITYVKFSHYNEMISGCFFKMLATKKGEMAPLLLKCRKLIEQVVKPILSEDDYNKTIGTVLRFLKNRKKIKEMGIIANKGLLLWGEPGNGKTLITAYLRDLCRQKGLSVNIVSEKKIHEGNTGGDVLIMDDFSIEPLIKRNATTDILLSEMDGPNKEGGRVYIITTNEFKQDKHSIEEALMRPGRIDTVVKLKKPTDDLRLRYAQSWKIKLSPQICEEVVKKTKGWSFAQMNYLHTEIVLSHIEGNPINVDKAMDMCNIKINDNVKGTTTKQVGFGAFYDE